MRMLLRKLSAYLSIIYLLLGILFEIKVFYTGNLYKTFLRIQYIAILLILPIILQYSILWKKIPTIVRAIIKLISIGYIFLLLVIGLGIKWTLENAISMGEEMKKYPIANLVYNTIRNFLGLDFEMEVFENLIKLFIYLNAL
jgi:hypothetical protein